MCEPTDYTKLFGFAAGFTLGGYVQPSGVIKATHRDEYISEWPKEVQVGPNVFTLECTTDSPVDPETGIKFQNAEYV